MSQEIFTRDVLIEICGGVGPSGKMNIDPFIYQIGAKNVQPIMFVLFVFATFQEIQGIIKLIPN